MTVWTPELDQKVRELRSEGLSFRQIGMRLGLTKNQVLGRINRRGGYRRAYAPPKPKSSDNGSWDAKLFEPWSEYSARRKAERAAMRG